jgi:hypothetical protein
MTDSQENPIETTHDQTFMRHRRKTQAEHDVLDTKISLKDSYARLVQTGM